MLYFKCILHANLSENYGKVYCFLVGRVLKGFNDKRLCILCMVCSTCVLWNG